MVAMLARWSFALILVLLGVGPLAAQLPKPRLDRVTPLGGKAGATVQVQVAADSVEEAKTLWCEHPGIKAEWVKDRTFNVTVAKDVPPGTYDLRVRGKYGVTNPRLFVVQNQFPEVTEKEPNDEPTTAQELAVNSVLNGTSDGNRDDYFKFSLVAGQRLVVECFAQRLESSLDATLVLMDAAGKQLVANSDHHGRDPQLDFIAPAAGTYFVKLTDLTYRGGLPYRLVVSDQAHVETVFPRAIPAGKASTLTAYGRNLGTTGKASTWKFNDLPLEERPLSVTPPDVLATGSYRFTSHPHAHSVLPTGATTTLVGWQTATIPPLFVTPLPMVLDTEPNDDRTKPQVVTLPVCVAGRFDQPRDADWFEFTTDTAGKYSLEVYSERLAGQADPYLVLYDAKGNRVQEVDDFGIRTNAFDAHVRDPQVTLDLPAKSTYRVLVQDRYRRGGVRFQYVFTIQAAKPDFFPALIHSENPNPTGFNVPKGGAYHVDVIVHNMGGFTGSVTLTATNLPNGVHAVPTTITNDTRGTLVFWADGDAPDFLGPVTVQAVGKVGDQTITRDVRGYTRPGGQNEMAGSRPTRDILLCVQQTAPYALQFENDRFVVEAGKKIEVKLKAERRWPEFKGAINAISNSTFGPIKLSQTNIAEGKTEGIVTLDIATNARPGEYTVAMLGQAQVPFSKDDKPKANTLVAQTSRPLTVVVTAPPAPAKK